jgi:hypothetical protein
VSYRIATALEIRYSQGSVLPAPAPPPSRSFLLTQADWQLDRMRGLRVRFCLALLHHGLAAF